MVDAGRLTQFQAQTMTNDDRGGPLSALDAAIGSLRAASYRLYPKQNGQFPHRETCNPLRDEEVPEIPAIPGQDGDLCRAIESMSVVVHGGEEDRSSCRHATHSSEREQREQRVLSRNVNRLFVPDPVRDGLQDREQRELAAEDLRYRYEERAAIMEHGGGLSRLDAEAWAFTECVAAWCGDNICAHDLLQAVHHLTAIRIRIPERWRQP